MTGFQEQKAVVLAHQAAIAGATPETVAAALAAHTHPDWHWRGMHPFHEQRGAQDVARAFWQPLMGALTRLQRRADVFFAGQNADGGVWVASMGHLMGLFDAPFLGIAPTQRIAMLRYAEFHRVVDGVIVETAQFCDLLHLMQQAGVNPLTSQTGVHLVQPGPATHDGLLYDPRPGGDATLALIERMIGAIAANSNTGPDSRPAAATPQEELAQDWHDDMIWWGPEGIGATYTIDRYITQHQQPFRKHLTNRTFNGHIARVAEGNYGGFFGWPNLTLTPTGGYMDIPADGTTTADMRVVDIYRRSGGKLAENWIFIDMLHFLNMQGVDVLGQLTAAQPEGTPTAS